MFLTTCQNYLEAKRFGFIIALLDGQALEWMGPLLGKNSEIVCSLDRFKSELMSVLDHNTTDQMPAVRLVNLSLGRKSVPFCLDQLFFWI